MEFFYFERSGEMPPHIEVTKMNDGLGMDNQTGTISRMEREAQEGNEDLAVLTNEAITSPQIITPVDRDAEGTVLDDDAASEKAFLSELIYTLATAAVLTKGDLPVYAVAKAPQDNYALAA